LIHLTDEHSSSFRADVDDVNNMNETTDTGQQAVGGISRRDMIKASVIAGGLVWTAPVLLTGKAAAQEENCCQGGTLVAVKITQLQTVNCGVSCLDLFFPNNPKNIACCDPLAEALVTVTAFDKDAGTATVTVNGVPPNSIVGAAARSNNAGCFRADCLNDFDDGASPHRVDVMDNQVLVNLQPSDGVLQHVEIVVCVQTAISPFCH
jgi:hypothetical protein